MISRNLTDRLGETLGISHIPFGLVIFGMLAGSIMTLAVLTAPAPAQGQDAVAEAKAGLEVWKSSGCAGCHGKFAQGGGGGEQPEGPSLRGSELDHLGVVEQVTAGGRQMPSFDGVIAPEEISAVATFLIEQVIGNADVTLEECTFYYGPYEGGVHPSCVRYQ